MTSPDLPAIQTDSLVRTYRMGDVVVRALRGVSVSIERGEFVAVMGASGSGKSTFMNVLGCLDRPDEGSYRLDGTDVSTLTREGRADVRRRKIGFVFQSFNLIPRMSARENVELPMIYEGTPSSERRRRADEALASVGLLDRADHRSNQMSGGQQQRVAVARAIVNNPSLVLADEPTGNLDTQTSVEVIGLFQRLNAERQLTVVLVTHETDIAAYAKRILRFVDGEVVGDIPVIDRRVAPVPGASV